MASWKFPVLEEVSLGADAADGAWAQAQQTLRTEGGTADQPVGDQARFFHRVVDRLGERLAGSFEAIRGHSPLTDIPAATGTARAAGADLLELAWCPRAGPLMLSAQP